VERHEYCEATRAEVSVVQLQVPRDLLLIVVDVLLAEGIASFLQLGDSEIINWVYVVFNSLVVFSI